MMISFFRFIDKYLIGFFLLIFFRLKHIPFVNKNKIKQSPKKILVIRLWALGSSLLTFPMIKQLKDHYGDNIQYDLLATSRNIGVFKNQGYFDNIYNLFSLKTVFKLIFAFKKYDIVIDTEEYFRISAFISMRLGKINVGFNNIPLRGLAYNIGVKYNDEQHSVLTCLDLIKAIGIEYKIPKQLEPLKYTEKDSKQVDEFLNGFEYSKIICMHTGLAETVKERAWPKNKRVELIQKVIDKDRKIKIVLSGTRGEYDSVQNIFVSLPKKYHNNVINICGMFNLFGFAYLLEKCDLMVSNDTGPMHLAAAMGTKTIGLFGPNLPTRFGPYPLDKNVSLYKGNYKAYINVHLGKFEKDVDCNIKKIKVEDILENI